MRSRASITRSQKRSASRSIATWVGQLLGRGSPQVGDRHAESERARELDVERGPHRAHDARVDDVGHGAGVVHGRVVEALGVLVGVREEVQQLAREAGRSGTDRGDARGDLIGRERLVGDIEPDHRERPARREHDVRGLRVDDDVELARRAPVAHVHASTHEHDLLDPLDDARLAAHGESDVGEGAGRHERDGARLVRHDRVDDEVDRVAAVELDRGLGQHGPVEPRLSVDVGRRLDLAHERALRPAGERHRVEPDDSGDGERVARDLLDRLIAHDGRDGEQVDLGRAVGEHEGDRVVVAGVAVQDDLLGHGPSLASICIYEIALHLCRVRS